MTPKQIARLARVIRADIDAEHSAMSKPDLTVEEHGEAQRRTHEARGLAVYLIQHLDRRHDAALLARSLGMSGYINLR